MIVKIDYTVKIDDNFRKAISAYCGWQGKLASYEEIKEIFMLYGISLRDILYEGYDDSADYYDILVKNQNHYDNQKILRKDNRKKQFTKLTKKLLDDGYEQEAPSNATWIADDMTYRYSKCLECGYIGLKYHPFTNSEGYRVFIVCPACGLVNEPKPNKSNRKRGRPTIY